MSGIPNVLLTPTRKALIDCDELFSPRQLRAVFEDERLRLWQAGLPFTDNVGEQADFLISYLANKHRTSGENALVLLLHVLGERHDPDDERHNRLLNLAEQLEWSRQRATRPESTILEANPHMARMIWTADLEKMLTCAKAVARIEVPRYLDGSPSGGSNSGTIWLIAPGLALTCWHVVENRRVYDDPITPADLQAQVRHALVTFDYTAAGKGVQYDVTALEHPAPEIQSLDYAILRLNDREDAPLRELGYLHLDIDAPLTTQTSLYIIQHPLGQPQQGIGDTYVRTSPVGNRILYKTPTEPGTSGAPVFNRINWRVVALHNGENQVEQLREGTLVKAILVDLRAHRRNLYDEIMNAQAAKE